ncbi:MAG: GIY-YIG nuclease family protein [Candidatus Aenigmarchaeota archaeon]|nr:GIY-YIG nuclease family protein [Candidatus Aenigmarchaeota archaeon]
MKGVYVLVVKVDRDTQEKIGALGMIRFRKGTYAYVGSAQNSLEKRIARHLSEKKNLFWHIDYLLNNKHAKATKVFYRIAEKSEECRIANILKESEDPVPKFGCSDCSCGSHLFRIKDMKSILRLGLREL